MSICLLSIGRDRNDPLVLETHAYLDRVRKRFPVQVHELREEPLRKNMRPEEVRRKEARRLLEKLPERARLVCLDGRGQMKSSEEWARDLEDVVLVRKLTLTMVVGGPVGLDPELLARADERRSLGPLTLPHRMARLIVAEQLYRAVTILNEEPYHK
ncbi:MAG: 23S rRNA (pseudouridine(1915)-N(3))-methyltransferase RlmH [Myxococcota bacterium]